MKLDHVGIAVESIDAVLGFYEWSLGLVVSHREDVAAQGVRVAFLKDPADSGAPIELLEPLGGEGAVAKFLKSRGAGMHHLAFKAADISKEMKRLEAAGRPPLDRAPRLGARGHAVCFLHPKHAGGVLVELVGSGDDS